MNVLPHIHRLTIPLDGLYSVQLDHEHILLEKVGHVISPMSRDSGANQMWGRT